MGLISLIKEEIEYHKKKKIKKQNAESQYFSQSGVSYFESLLNTGTRGEIETYKKIIELTNSNACIANCYVPISDEYTSEIDLILVHETGIYVFESKNYSGYIFGSDNQRYWTQTLNGGYGRVEKHRFVNPILQNKSHITYLKKYLNMEVPFYSYIVFSDRCEFKGVKVSNESNVVHRCELLDVLEIGISKRRKVLSEEKISFIFKSLDSLSHKNKSDKSKHIENLNRRIEIRNKNISNYICPNCKGKLILRTAKKGPNVGKKFYGCSNYPKCKYTCNV